MLPRHNIIEPRAEKWARQGSNLGPAGYEPDALPLSYGPVGFNLFTRPLSMSRKGCHKKGGSGDAELVL